MTIKRFIVLTAGPVALVGAAYALSFPAAKSGAAVRSAQTAQSELRSAQNRARFERSLSAECASVAGELADNLPASCHVIVRPPFVLAGDLTEDDLARLHREAVLPVTAALWRSFYDRKPDEPVTIVALRDETSYHAVALSLDGYEPLAYAGYTQRGKRRIVCNLETGRGTLTHELAHVLASFDFPDMPEWFDEGLAALHEDAAFSRDGLTLTGMDNWRSRLLGAALRRGELPEIESVILAPEFRGEGEGVNYAVVRSLCHYLQDRGLLSHFYRKFRSAVHDDPNGIATLCELLGVKTLSEIDREFRAWVLQSAAR